MYVCAGACAGASVPPSLFANHAGGTSWKHCGAILRRFWDDFGSILDHFASIGHILVPPGTIFETPFPRFGKKSILRRFSGESLIPLGTPFSPLGITFSLCGASGAENRCFFRHPCYNSLFGTISGQKGAKMEPHRGGAHAIRSCLCMFRQGSTFSSKVTEDRILSTLGSILEVILDQKWYEIVTEAHFWGPVMPNGGQKWRSVFSS